MLALKKHFSRSTQKIKRSIKGQKHTDETFDTLIHTVHAEQRAIGHFDRHVTQMIIDMEDQCRLYRSLGDDLHLMYSCGSAPVAATTSTTTTSVDTPQDDLEEATTTMHSTTTTTTTTVKHSDLGTRVEAIADRMQQEVVQPFIQRARVVQQKLEGYKTELGQLEKTEVIKRRNNRLLDFEIIERKFHAAQSKPPANPQAEKELVELSAQYDTVKLQFDELDKQAKEILRGAIIRRYTVIHDVLAEFFYEILGQYHSAMGKLSQVFFEIHHSVQAPQPLGHELMDATSESILPPIPKFAASSSTAVPDILLPESSSAMSTKGLSIGKESGYLNVGVEQQATTTGGDLLDLGGMETLSVSKAPESRLSRAMELGGPTHSIVEAPYRPKSLDPTQDIVTTTKPDPWANFPSSIDNVKTGESSMLDNLMLPTDSTGHQQTVVHDHIHDVSFDKREVPSEINQSWFYLDDSGERQGPVSFPELRMLKSEGVVHDETQIFTDGMDKWVPLKEQINLPTYMV